MPNPFAESTKIAKKLQEEAKKIQETRNSLAKELEELEKFLPILKRLNANVQKEEYAINSIKESLSKKALDLDGVRNSLDVLRHDLLEEFQRSINEKISKGLKKLLETYKDTSLEIKIQEFLKLAESDYRLEDVTKIINSLEEIFQFIKARIKCEISDPLSEFDNCVNYLNEIKRDYSYKLQKLLMEVSKSEAFLIRNKIDFNNLAELKEKSRDYYKNIELDKSISSLEEYNNKLKKLIEQKLEKDLEEIKAKLSKLEGKGVDVSPIKESLLSMDIKNYEDASKTYQMLKKLNDQLDTLLLDFALKKLTTINSKVDSLQPLIIGQGVKNEIEDIRNLIKSQKIEDAIIKMNILESNLDNLKNAIVNIKNELKNYATIVEENQNLFTKEILNQFRSLSSSEKIDLEKWNELKEVLDIAIKGKINEIKGEIKGATELIEKIGIKIPVHPDFSKFDTGKNIVEQFKELSEIYYKIADELSKSYLSMINQFRELGVDQECPNPERNLKFLINNYSTCEQKLISKANVELENLFNDLRKLNEKLSIINLKFQRINESLLRIYSTNNLLLKIRLFREIKDKEFGLVKYMIEAIEGILNLNSQNKGEAENVDYLINLYESYKNSVSKSFEKIINGTLDLMKFELGIQDKNAINEDADKILEVKLSEQLNKIKVFKWYRVLINEDKNADDLLSVIAKRVLQLYYTNKISSEALLKIICLQDGDLDLNSLELTPDLIIKRGIDEEFKIFFNVINEGSFQDALRDKVIKLIRENGIDKKTEDLLLRNITADPAGTYFKVLSEIAKRNNDYVLAEVTNVILHYMSIDFVKDYILRDATLSKKYDAEVLNKITNNDYLGAYLGLYEILKDYLPLFGLLKIANHYYALFSSDSDLRNKYGKELEKLEDSIRKLDFTNLFNSLNFLISEYNRYKNETADEKVQKNLKFVRGLIGINLLLGNYCANVNLDFEESYRVVVQKAKNDLKELGSELNYDLTLYVGVPEKIGEYLLTEKINILKSYFNIIIKLSSDIENALLHFAEPETIKTKSKIDSINITNINEVFNNLRLLKEEINEKVKKYSLSIDKNIEPVLNGEIDYSTLFVELVSKLVLPNEFIEKIIDKDKIAERIKELNSNGYNLAPDDVDALKELAKELKPEIILQYEKAKGERKFLLKINITNAGNWKLYDATVAWLDKEKTIGDIEPKKLIELNYDYNIKKDEPFKVYGQTLDFSTYEKVFTIKKLETLLRFKSNSRLVCASCRGAILPGIDAGKCEYCGSMYHLKCAERSKSCKVCGIEFNL